MSNLSRLLTLASQGNPKAISTIISRSLKPDGIRAIAKLDRRCLHVILEGGEIPDRAFSWYVSERVEGFGAKTIETLRIYGRQAGDTTVAWQTEMTSAPSGNVFETEALPDLLDASQASSSDRLLSSPLLEDIPQPFDENQGSGLDENSLNRDRSSVATGEEPSFQKPVSSGSTTHQILSDIDNPTFSETASEKPAIKPAISFFDGADSESDKDRLPASEAGGRTKSFLDEDNHFSEAETEVANHTAAEQPLPNSANNQTVAFFEGDADTAEAPKRSAEKTADPAPSSRGFPLLEPGTQTPAGNALLLSSDNVSPVSPTQAEGLHAAEAESTEFWGNGDTLANVDFGEDTNIATTDRLVATGQDDEERVPVTHDNFAFSAQDYGDAFTEAELAELTGDPSSTFELEQNPLNKDELDTLAEADELTEAELAELARAKQPLPLSKAAVAIALLACAALSGLGGLYLFRNQWLPQSTSKPVPAPEVATSSEAASPNTQPKPTPETVPVSQNSLAPTSAPGTPVRPFQAAVNQAIEAANLTQFATTQSDWQVVVDRWQNAIAFLEAVPEESPKYATAQEKIGEYQKNLGYAQQKFDAAPPE